MAKRAVKPGSARRTTTEPPADPGKVRFEAALEKMPGRFAWTYVEFPHDVQKLFGTRASVRVKGMINGVALDRALIPTKSGFHIIVLGTDIRRQAKVKVGDLARFEIWRDMAPDHFHLPEELQETLDFFPEFKAGWETVRPGMKRSILIWLNSGKTVATRAKRVAEILRRFETGHAWFPKSKKPDRP